MSKKGGMDAAPTSKTDHRAVGAGYIPPLRIRIGDTVVEQRHAGAIDEGLHLVLGL